MAENNAKFKSYVNKLYKGKLKLFKEKQKKAPSFTLPSFLAEESKSEKGKRVTVNSSQGKVVIDKCKKKCIICNKPYNDPDDFQIHHVDGDRTKSVTSNLVLICNGHHRKIHTYAKAKLKDYTVGRGIRPSNSGNTGLADIPKFHIPQYKIPKFKIMPKF